MVGGRSYLEESESPGKINETWDGGEIRGELMDIDKEGKDELHRYMNNFNFKQLVSPKQVFRTPTPHLTHKLKSRTKQEKPRQNVITSHSMQTLPSETAHSRSKGALPSGRDSNSGSLYVNGIV